MDFGKVLTAMVTPFAEDGKLNLEEAGKLVEHLIATGTEGIVVCGTTGESPTLAHDEKLQLFRKVVEVADGRAKIIAGTGGNNTEVSINLTKEAEECGVDAIMQVTPSYNKPNQRGLHAHFSAIAESTALPIMLYNIPGRSSCNLEADTTISLSKIDNIVSVKEASGNFNQASKIIRETGDDFSVYCGDDSLTLPMLSIGSAGIVSVAAHVIGKQMSEMVTEFLSGNHARAAELHGELLPVMTGMFIAPSPAPVKAALRLHGIEPGGLRLPLVGLTDEEEQFVKDLFK